MPDEKYQSEKLATSVGSSEYNTQTSGAEEIADDVDWYIFFYGYLRLSELGCSYLLEKDRWLPMDKFIIVGVFYNLKHGFEIILKAFSKSVSGNFDGGHNINVLFRALKKRKNIKSKKKIAQELDKLEVLIKDYYDLRFLEKHFNKCINILDLENTLFKYPENSVILRMDYAKLLSRFSSTDINRVKDDIDKTLKIVKKIKFLIKNK